MNNIIAKYQDWEAIFASKYQGVTYPAQPVTLQDSKSFAYDQEPENVSNTSKIANTTPIAVNIKTLPADQTHILSTEHGSETIRWKYDLLWKAEQSIEFSPNYGGGYVLQLCLKIMSERLKVKENLQVHIVISNNFLEDLDYSLFKEIKNKYPLRFHYLITSKQPCWKYAGFSENHEKLLIVDEKYFVAGGSGIKASMVTRGDEKPTLTTAKKTWDSYYVSPSFRDMDVVGCGALSKVLRTHFFDLFQTMAAQNTKQYPMNRYFKIDEALSCKFEKFESCSKVIRNVAIKVLFSNPNRGNEENQITKAICKSLLSAKKAVTIAHMDFNLQRPLNKLYRRSKIQKFQYF